jgi:hypothetical protein
MLTDLDLILASLQFFFPVYSPSKDVYLSESGVYPIIVVLGFAGCLASYVIAAGLAYNPDVRISKKNRSAIIRE